MLVFTNQVKPIFINSIIMNIAFSTDLVKFFCTPGPDEGLAKVSFPFEVQSVEVSIKGFTLNYDHKEHEHKGEKHGDGHIASVQLGDPSISGNRVSCLVLAETPNVIACNANVLCIAIGR